MSDRSRRDGPPRRHRITIRDTGERYMCSEEKHLLGGMASMGKRGIPSGCHGGGCGVCKIRVLGPHEGYRTLPMSRDKISVEEEQAGIVLACRVFPRRDLELEVIGKFRKNVLKKGSGYVFGQPVKVNESETLKTVGEKT